MLSAACAKFNILWFFSYESIKVQSLCVSTLHTTYNYNTNPCVELTTVVILVGLAVIAQTLAASVGIVWGRGIRH